MGERVATFDNKLNNNYISQLQAHPWVLLRTKAGATPLTFTALYNSNMPTPNQPHHQQVFEVRSLPREAPPRACYKITPPLIPAGRTHNGGQLHTSSLYQKTGRSSGLISCCCNLRVKIGPIQHPPVLYRSTGTRRALNQDRPKEQYENTYRGGRRTAH